MPRASRAPRVGLGDRLLATFGLQRQAGPAVTPVSPSRRAFWGAPFQAGAFTRQTEDWSAINLSPDLETRYTARHIRARARWLVRNNEYAFGFTDALATNVIGPDGILLQAKIAARDGTLNQKTNKAIEAAWCEWDLPENASADGHDSWVDIQRLVLQTIATDGECFVRKLPYFDNAFSFALQIIDADLVDDFLHRRASTGENEIKQGVEVDQYNRPVAYHVWTRHPTDVGERIRERIPASEIEHLFVRYRPNQVRGVSWFAPVLMNVKMLDGYEEAELEAARIAACKMGFFVTKNPDFAPLPPEGNVGDVPEANQRRQMVAEPGMFEELPAGQEIQTFDPNNPNPAFKDFTKAILRGIARGLGMAYTTLTGDLEAVNYSSIRAGLLEERDKYRALQTWLAKSFHRKVYREWLSCALLTGALSVDSRLASSYYAVQWRPRGWKWVDPLNDLRALELAISLGVASRTKAAAEIGIDYEDNVDDLALEQEYADQAGVYVGGVAMTPGGGLQGTVGADGQPADGAAPAQDSAPAPAKRKPAAAAAGISPLRLAAGDA